MNATTLISIATSVAQERTLNVVLQRIVAELSGQANVALTRIWLAEENAQNAAVSPSEESRFLKLVASAGRSLQLKQADAWNKLDGAFQRIPFGSGKVGEIGATGQSILLENVEGEERWIVNTRWAQSEGIISFAGHALIFRGEILGVLALFSRERLGNEDFVWLRAFADQAAIAIANARAFEEIERLRARLVTENRYLRAEVNEAHAYGEILGDSLAIRKLREQIDLVAPTNAGVLILGESGTGKELVARAIHQRSQRGEGPLVKVNCAAIPRELFESEFFGHVKGSFTGALQDRCGRFQLADGGTLFLDEVGEIPLDLQGKLLRVLQEGLIERVGDDQTRRIDVRVIAATNRDLEADVAAGRFRQDLYFRLSVFPIEIAPLRERLEDIPILATHFYERLCRQMKRHLPSLAPDQIHQFQNYAWPGNVRELQNLIERAIISARNGIAKFSLPGKKHPGRSSVSPRLAAGLPMTNEELQQLEVDNLRYALETANGKVYGPSGAAELLAMPPTTLLSRMKKLGINKPR